MKYEYWKPCTQRGIERYINTEDNNERNKIYNQLLYSAYTAISKTVVIEVQGYWTDKEDYLYNHCLGELSIITEKIREDKIKGAQQYLYQSLKNNIINQINKDARKVNNDIPVHSNNIDSKYNLIEGVYEHSIYDIITIQDVMTLAQKLAKNRRKLKHSYNVWYDYYILRNNYYDLSYKYGLTITPLWGFVQEMNRAIRSVLFNHNSD